MRARLCAWWQRFCDKHAPVIDWPDVGSDDGWPFADEPASIEYDDPCLDPARHAGQGCQPCLRSIASMRDLTALADSLSPQQLREGTKRLRRAMILEGATPESILAECHRIGEASGWTVEDAQ